MDHQPASWTETLTFVIAEDELDRAADQIETVAQDLDLVIGEIKVRKRRSWSKLRVDIEVTGTPDRVSDFQEVFFGETWTNDKTGSLLDPFINEGLQASQNWVRRKRRQRRADRDQAHGE